MKKILYGILSLFLISCCAAALYIFRPELSGAANSLLRRGLEETAAGYEDGRRPAFSDSETGQTAGTDSKNMENSISDADGTAGQDQGSGPDQTGGGTEDTESGSGDSRSSGLSDADALLAKDQNTGEKETGYQPPDRSDLSASAQVSGRNGYERVKEESVQVSKDTANQLGTGPTGEGLTFDVEFYPYYSMLDTTGQQLYRQLYANANALNPAFKPVAEVDAGQLKNVFSAVFNDHPELFWMDSSYTCKYLQNGPCVEIGLSFNRTAQDINGAKAAFDARANEITAQAQGLPNAYEKEKYVYHALIDSVTYDLGSEMNQSAYSALVNGQSVCAGYARAFQYLLRQLGIPCYYCTGYAGEDHAWNIVRLDDGYYNVDPTWGDVEGSRYAFFNRSDADYADTHVRQELSVYLPPCSGQAYRDLDSDYKRLEEVGLDESRVFADMQSYYGDCYNQITGTGVGDYTFTNVLEGEALLDEWYQNYQAEAYKQAYMENAMTAVGATSCQISLEIEELHGKRFLVVHTVSIH